MSPRPHLGGMADGVIERADGVEGIEIDLPHIDLEAGPTAVVGILDVDVRDIMFCF